MTAVFFGSKQEIESSLSAGEVGPAPLDAELDHEMHPLVGDHSSVPLCG